MSPKLEKAIQAIKAGDKETGKQLLVELLEVERRNYQVWLWLAEVLDTDEERIKSLQNVLKLNPDHDVARERLDALLYPPLVEDEDEDVFDDDFTFEDQPGFEDEVAFEDQPGFEDEVSFEDQPESLDDAEDEAVFEDDVVFEDEVKFEDDIEFEDDVEYEDEYELEAPPPSTMHPLIEQFNAADNRQKLMIIVPIVVVAFCTSCCLFGVVVNFLFGSGSAPEQAAVEPAPVVEGTDTPTPTPTLPSGLVLPPAETDVLPTTPLEPTSTNTPVVPPTGTPSSTPGPTDIPLPAAEGEGEGEPQGTPPPPTFQEAQVLEVIDGDTIRVSLDGTEYTVDFLLIDTPETTEPVQLFGPEATEFNRVLLEGKAVRLEEDVSRTGPDGHLLRYVWFNDLLVNEEILRQGLARVVPSPTDLRHLERFLTIQNEAQAAGIGLWSAAANPPTPPPLVDETPDGSNAEHNADLGN